MQVVIDACLVALAYYLAFALRFDYGIPHRYRDLLVGTVLFVVLGKLLIFGVFGLYSKLWRFIDQKDFVASPGGLICTPASWSALLPALARRHQPAARRCRARLPADAGVASAARFLVRMLLVERSFRAPLPCAALARC